MKKLILLFISFIFTVVTAYEVSSRFGGDETSRQREFKFGGYGIQFQPSTQFSGGFKPFPFSVESRLPHHKSSSASGSSSWLFAQPRGDSSYLSAKIPSSSFDFSDTSGFRGHRNSPGSFQWNQNDRYGLSNGDKGFGGFGFDSKYPSRFGDNGRSHSTGNWYSGRGRFVGQFPNGQGLWSHDRIPPYFFIYPTLNKGCPSGGGDKGGFTTEESSSMFSTDTNDITTESGIDATTEDSDNDEVTDESTDENEDNDGTDYAATETVGSPEIPNMESGEGEIRESENVGEEIQTKTIKEESDEKIEP